MGLLEAGELSIGRAVVSAASSGDNTLVVAAGANKKIRVKNIVLIASGTVTVTFKSGSTAVTGAMPLADQVGFAPGEAEDGHFETTANAALVLNLSGAVGVYGWLVYAVVRG